MNRTTGRRDGVAHSLSLAILAALCFAISAPRAATAYPAVEKATYGPAHIEIDRGLPVVHLYGTHREMGEQAGRLLRDQIRFLLRNYVFEVLTKQQRERFTPSIKAMEWRIPETLRDEMRGLAAGAEVDYDDILFANAFVDLGQAMACSTLALMPERSQSGEVMLARNLEFITLGVIEEADVLFVYHGDGEGPAVASVGWPGMIGVVSGMNSAGLSAAMLVSLQSNPQLAALPSVIAFRHFLETRTTADEAPAFFQDNKVILPSNLAVADATTTLVVELNPYTGIGVRRADDGFVVCTNLFAGALNNDTEFDWRYRQLRDDANSRTAHSFMDLRRYLGGAILEGTGVENFQAMIFIPASRTLYLSAKDIPAANGKYLRYDLRKAFETRAAAPPAGEVDRGGSAASDSAADDVE
jgi:predicted choloylglycine hydrolase